MDQHMVTMISRKNGSPSCSLRLSTIAHVSGVLGIITERVDQHELAKEQWNNK